MPYFLVIVVVIAYYWIFYILVSTCRLLGYNKAKWNCGSQLGPQVVIETFSKSQNLITFATTSLLINSQIQNPVRVYCKSCKSY